MKLRGIAVGMVLLLGASGCDLMGDLEDPQVIEMVAGGGSADSGPAAGAAIRGRLIDMVMGRDGELHVLTQQDLRLVMWSVSGGGLTRVVVKNVDAEYVSQAGVGADGSVHVALRNGNGGVWEIRPDGTSTQETKVAADGLAFGAAGQLTVAEQRLNPVAHHVVQTAGKTVLGRDLATVNESQWRSAGTRSGFTDGTAGTKITAEGADSLPLAVAPDGRIYAAATDESIILVRPNGTTHHTAGSVDDVADWPEEPFLTRGRATDVTIHMARRSGLVTDTAGNLYFVNDTYEWGFLPGSFDWTGDVTDEQRDLLIESRDQRAQDTEILRVTPDGSAATVAGHADAVAVHDDWIYLARAFRDDSGTDRVLVVRTASR